MVSFSSKASTAQARTRDERRDRQLRERKLQMSTLEHSLMMMPDDESFEDAQLDLIKSIFPHQTQQEKRKSLRKMIDMGMTRYEDVE